MSELPTLYKIADDYHQVLDWMQDPDADPESFGLLLEQVKGDLQTKAIRCAAVVRSIESLVAQIKDAETTMAKRRKILESRARHVRDYLLYHLEQSEISIVDSPEFRLQVKKSPPAVEIVSEWEIPSKYMKREWVTKPDRRKIAAALKAGETVAGCRLSHTTRLEIK